MGEGKSFCVPGVASYPAVPSAGRPYTATRRVPGVELNDDVARAHAKPGEGFFEL